jgi:hypothetical protein
MMSFDAMTGSSLSIGAAVHSIKCANQNSKPLK